MDKTMNINGFLGLISKTHQTFALFKNVKYIQLMFVVIFVQGIGKLYELF
jgi:hypothetical protein